MTSYGTATYSYGPAGDLRTRTAGSQTTTYSYDSLGNLMGAWLPDGSTIEYVVDGLGRRIGKKLNGVMVEGFLYEGQLRPVAWLDGTGNAYARFVYGTRVNVPEYMVTASGTFRFLTDHLGSPRLVVDVASGAIAQRVDYGEWGQVILDTNPGFQPFGFAGGLYDRDTGLVRFGARDYDPAVGRWTNKDPLRFGGADTNLYVYVAGDPIDRTDSTGMWSWTFEAYAGVGGALVVGQDPATGAWFWGGRLGIGLGAGYTSDPKGRRPGADAASCGGNHTGTSAGFFGQFGVNAGPAQMNWQTAAGYDFGSNQSYVDPLGGPSPASGSIDANEAFSAGFALGVEIIGHQ
jgi:RHS repeat-associated protein